jgi:hypothetical protein
VLSDWLMITCAQLFSVTHIMYRDALGFALIMNCSNGFT